MSCDLSTEIILSLRCIIWHYKKTWRYYSLRKSIHVVQCFNVVCSSLFMPWHARSSQLSALSQHAQSLAPHRERLVHVKTNKSYHVATASLQDPQPNDQYPRPPTINTILMPFQDDFYGRVKSFSFDSHHYFTLGWIKCHNILQYCDHVYITLHGL